MAGPVFGCLPVCSLFTALAIVGVGMALWMRGQPAGESEPIASDRPFPLWLFVVLPAAVFVLTALIGWFGPDY